MLIILLIPFLGVSQGLMITEIADPNTASGGTGGHNYRYIELFNNSNSDVTLSNYDIKIATKSMMGINLKVEK